MEIYQKYIEAIEEQMKNEQILEKERGRNRSEIDEDPKRDIELRLK